MKRSITYIICAIAALSLLTACTSDELSAYADIPSSGWAYADTVDLDLWAMRLPTDTSALRSGQLSIVVRHDNSYEFSNIWLQVVSHMADTIVVDTINMPLADVYGKWLGRGIGVSFQCQMPLGHVSGLDLREPLQVSHIMRADTLPHIEQIGVVFTPIH